MIETMLSPYAPIIGMLVAGMVWAIRQEGRINTLSKGNDDLKEIINIKFDANKELLNAKFDANDQRLARIERALNGALRREG